MKIKIAYLEKEKTEAEELAGLYVKELQLRRPVLLTRSDRHKPFFHIYIQDRYSPINDEPKQKKPKKKPYKKP